MKKTIAEINEVKCWFFETISKIDKLLARLIKKKREINKIRNEKGKVTTDNAEIKRIIRGYYEQLYGKKKKENWITWKKWTDSKKRSIFQD